MASVRGKLVEGALGSHAAVEADAAVNVSDLLDLQVTYSGTFVGTWILEVSFDQGTTWAQFDTGTAAKLTAVLPRCGRIRSRCSAYTSGTIVANYSGTDPNRV